MSAHRSVNSTVAAFKAVSVTPSDVTVIPVTRAIYIGGAGNIRVVFAEDSTSVDLIGVLAGTILPLQVKQIYSTGTTATNLVALY